MSGQITFFNKSLIDIDQGNITITVTDAVATNNGTDFVNYMRNRKNDSGWITTGSTDAANTTLDVDFTDEIDFTDILLVSHNLGAYTIQYWDGSAYQDFSTAITETTNTETTNHYNFTSVESSKLKIIITGAQTVDADKVIRQLIVTRRIGDGQLEGWPIIKKPTLSTNRKSNKMLSGKISQVESIESFSCQLTVAVWSSDDDMDIVEGIYFKHQGVLLWLCGGDESQFKNERINYRKEDIYLVRPVNEYSNEYYKGVYSNGQKITLELQESVN